MDKELLVKQLKAMSEEKRIEILNILSKQERCACVLLESLDLTQSGLSYHMKILSEAKIVNCRQEGKWTHYSINQEFKRNILDFIENL